MLSSGNDREQRVWLSLLLMLRTTWLRLVVWLWSPRDTRLLSDRNQRFEKVAASAGSRPIVDLSAHSSNSRVSTSSEVTLFSTSIAERAENSTDTEQTAP